MVILKNANHRQSISTSVLICRHAWPRSERTCNGWMAPMRCVWTGLLLRLLSAIRSHSVWTTKQADCLWKRIEISVKVNSRRRSSKSISSGCLLVHLDEIGTNTKYTESRWWLTRNEWRHCRTKIVLFTFFVRIKCHWFSRNACTLKFYYTDEGPWLCPLPIPHPHHFSKLNFISKMWNLTMQISAYQD